MNSIKNLAYKILTPPLRSYFAGTITGKNLTGTGLKLFYDKSQFLSFLFKREIDYEKGFRDTILSLIRPGDIVFEIGSNIGIYSLLISDRIGKDGKLVCVEPDSTNYAFLSFNVLQNGCSNVQLIRSAVSDKPGQTIFYKDTVTGGRMGSLIKKFTGNNYEGKSEIVQLITYSSLIDRMGIPDFVKVDVEGAEDLVFKDPATIHPKTTFMIEVREETKTGIYNLFTGNGFEVFLLDASNKKMNSAHDIPGFSNLLIKHPSITK